MKLPLDLNHTPADLEEAKEMFRRAAVELAAAQSDARRYRFLKSLFHSIDFEYGDSSEGTTPSLVFAIPPDTRWSGNLDMSIDAAIAAAQSGEAG